MPTYNLFDSEIPHDDRLILRKFIKQDYPTIINIFQQFRKDKSSTQLQIKLRKFIHSVKFPQKKSYNLCQNSEKNKTNESQRIYSQNSQTTSYKNSLKCSPEKEEQKKKVINLDIAQIKKKIQNPHQSFVLKERQILDYQRSNSIKQSCGKRKQISITKINTYLPEKREKSQKKLDSMHKNANESRKTILAQQKTFQQAKISTNDINQNDFSKITLRVEHRKFNQHISQTPKGRQIEIISQQHQLQDISQNYCYSSNIKNLLTAKLKEQKEPRKNSKILIEDQKTTLKFHQIQNQIQRQQGKDPKYSQMKTLVKKQVKPLQKDQMPCSVRLFDQSDISFPIYLKSDSKLGFKNEGDIQTERDSSKKENSYIEMRKKTKGTANEYKIRQTEREQENFGKFFQKIKKIMQNKDL